MLSRPIIYALFSKHSSVSGGVAPNSHQSFVYGLRWGTKARGPYNLLTPGKNSAGAHGRH